MHLTKMQISSARSNDFKFHEVRIYFLLFYVHQFGFVSSDFLFPIFLQKYSFPYLRTPIMAIKKYLICFKYWNNLVCIDCVRFAIFSLSRSKMKECILFLGKIKKSKLALQILIIASEEGRWNDDHRYIRFRLNEWEKNTKEGRRWDKIK